MSQTPWLAGGVTTLGSAAAFLALDAPPLIGIDDANITQVYAANLAAGHGFVFNPGGERVEGFTSLAWVLLLVAGFWLPDGMAEWLALILGLAFSVLAVGLALTLAGRLARAAGMQARPVVWLAAGLIVLQPGFFAWSVFSLMEVALWTTALTALVLSLTHLVMESNTVPRRLEPAILLAGALSLVRPEGAAVAAGLTGFAALLIWHRRAPFNTAALRLALYGLAAAIAGALVMVLWRLAIFGYPAPNTFYAKVSVDHGHRLSEGLRYLESWLLQSPGHSLLLVGAAAALVCARGTRAFPALALSAAFVAGILVLYAFLGGDHFVWHRFYQPTIPALSVLAAVGTVALVGRGWRYAVALPLALCVLFLTVGFTGRLDRFAAEFAIAAHGREVGRALETTVPAGTSVGVIATGGIARAYGGPVRDLMGLNWVAMAHADRHKTGPLRNHAGFDPDTFWKTPPDIVVAVPMAQPCGAGPVIPGKTQNAYLKGLLDSPRFTERYRTARLSCRQVYVRADLHASLENQGFTRF